MNLSIVIIGDEILLGRVTDTNSGMIARTFCQGGWDVKSIVTVGDNAEDVRKAIAESLRTSELVVTTGGLGPTRDDMTKTILLDIFGGELVRHAESAANIERIFAERGLTMNELTRGQAMVPSSCRAIVNRYGTAPVMWFEREGRVLVAMPGVPYETRGMLPEVAEAVKEHFHPSLPVRHREFTVRGISESALAERLAPYEDSLPSYFKLAYLPSAGFILMRLDAHFSDCDSADSEFEERCAELVRHLGENFSGNGRLTPAEMVLTECRRRGLTLASAESCTGGNIAHLITQIPGCSDVYSGGVVSLSVMQI
ncbi:MAG: CinA family protein, partial [Muribaculaceae bacterium]|nr:CinA family protein [Muribaculaceae bacterium]